MSTTHKTDTTGAGVDFTEWIGSDGRPVCDRLPTRMDYISHPSFEDDGAEAKIFGDQGEAIGSQGWRGARQYLTNEKRSGGRLVLSADEEAALFLRYNYARYRISELLEQIHNGPSEEPARKLVRWVKTAHKLRSLLAEANMGLVCVMAKRTRVTNVEFDELISEGNMALLRCIDKFDVSRGFRFSTYACRAIRKSFCRLATTAKKQRSRFPLEQEDVLDRIDSEDYDHQQSWQDSVDILREVLTSNRARLNPVEQIVVRHRFALTPEGKKHTLCEVARTVGLTDERVRQIQNVALRKLRAALDKYMLVS